MAYIGNEPSVNFTSFAKQDITGDGTANYTLTYAVANANEIEVFVNNVRQEPTEAYTVSGTALSMTGNVASTDDFYVIYLGKALQTTVPPDASVSTAKIADSAVTNAKIADSTIDLTAKVTGVLPVANGGTGSSSSLFVTETTVATTSGTEVDFFNIPSTVKRITILFRGISVNDGGNFKIQLGTSSGLTSSGYISTSSWGAGGISDTTGFTFYGNTTNIFSGLMTICHMGSNVYISSHAGKYSTSAGVFGGGDVALSGTLDRLRIRPTTGSFDAGSVNIMYES